MIRDAIYAIKQGRNLLTWWSNQSSSLNAQSLKRVDERETNAGAMALGRKIKLTNDGTETIVVTNVEIHSELYTVPDRERIDTSGEYVKNRDVYGTGLEEEQIISTDDVIIHKPRLTLTDLSELPARFNVKLVYEYTSSDDVSISQTTAEEWVEVKNNIVA